MLVCTTAHRQILWCVNCVSCLFCYCSTQCTHIFIFYILCSTLPRYEIKGLFKSYEAEATSLLLCNSGLPPYKFITSVIQDRIRLHSVKENVPEMEELQKIFEKILTETWEASPASKLPIKTGLISLCPLTMQEATPPFLLPPPKPSRKRIPSQ